MPPAKRRPPVRKSAHAKTRTRQVTRRKPARADLLIIECNSAKLAADGLDFGSALACLANAGIAQAILSSRTIVLVKTSTEKNLMRDLIDTHEKYGRFRSILVVGHSGKTGLWLTADRRCSWSGLGSWLRPFEPEFVFLTACDVGGSEAVRDLFVPMKKSLRQVFASPVALHRNQTSPIVVLIGMLLLHGRIDENQSGALRLANFVLTGGQLFRWRRAEIGPGEEARATMWDGLASLLNG